MKLYVFNVHGKHATGKDGEFVADMNRIRAQVKVYATNAGLARRWAADLYGNPDNLWGGVHFELIGMSNAL